MANKRHVLEHKKPTSISLSREVQEQLKDRALKLNLSKSRIVEIALERYFEVKKVKV